MPKIDCISTDEEDDIWDYRSFSQKVKRSQSVVASQKSVRGKTFSKSQSQVRRSVGHDKVKQEVTEIKPDGKLKERKLKKPKQKNTKVKLEVTVDGTPNVKQSEDRSGRCPVCQMPFVLLSKIETCSWHIDQCLDVPYSSKNECPAGLECDSEIVSHYKKFRHTKLARSRRKNETNDDRDKGDVNSAKAKLNFDTKESDTKLVVPSAECVIIIDSSQESSFSQRSNEAILDESLNSEDSDVVQRKLYPETMLIGCDKMCDEVDSAEVVHVSKPEKKIEKGKVLDKNRNLVKAHGDSVTLSRNRYTCNGNDAEIFCNGDDVDLPNLAISRANTDESAGLTRIEFVDLSDDSCASIDDINHIVDENRSLSDMINDVLHQDTATATEDNETDDNVVENKKNAKKIAKFDQNPVDELEIDDDVDDPILELFRDKPKKQSAILSLGEPEANSPKSDISSDWEILKTTLTQPSFEMKDNDKELQTSIDKCSTQLYKESMKTPSKNSKKVEIKEEETVNDFTKMTRKESKEKQKVPPRGFFATKMLQNSTEINKIPKTHSFSSACDEIDKGQTERHKSILSSQKISKQDNNESCSLKYGEQFKNKRSASGMDRPQSVSGRVNSPKCESLMNEDNSTGDACFAMVKTQIPIKQELIYEPNILEKKPKIEVQSKTPKKRKIAKQQKVKKEKDLGTRLTSLSTFFKPKGTKSEPVSIQTDSDSSCDCERFNKPDKLRKCCDKCAEEQSLSNYAVTMNDLNDISRTDLAQAPSQTSKSTCRKSASFTSSKCSTCDSCLTCSRPVLLSSEATSGRNHGSSQSSPCSFKSQKCSGLGVSFQSSLSATCDYDRHTSLHRCEHSDVCSHHRQGPQTSQEEHNPTGSNNSSCYVSSQHNSFQTANQSSGNQTGSRSNQSKVSSHCSHDFRSQNKRPSQSQNSMNSSAHSLQFNIENVCTLSQNTYTHLEGGFINETGNCMHEPVNTSQCTKANHSGISCTSGVSQPNGDNSASVSDIELETIVQIRKSATDILMASSKLLYSKSAKYNAANNRNNEYSSSTRTNNEVQSRNSMDKISQDSSKKLKGNWNGEKLNTKWSRGSTSTETSGDSQGVKRKCPFYKKIPDTCMTVDAFRYGNIPDCRAYILSHFHYDHYIGLTKHFSNPIYCSKITGNLVKKKIGVDSSYINTVPLYTPTVVENIEVTFLEANHCPGAVLILFKLRSGKVYLHTGDFRACEAMEAYPQLQDLRIHTLYLDTTYCDPQYDFPPQEEVIQFTVKLALDALTSNPKTLIVCGSYTIGKERIFTAIAEELDCKICVTRDKKTVLDCMDDEKLKGRVSLRWEDSCLHVIPMNKINYQGLRDHLLLNGKTYNSVLGIEPTGWTHSKRIVSLYHIKPKVNKDNIKVYGVPYSEHSSFLEMKRFVKFTKPVKILPTVNNGNVHSRRKMEVIFEAWREELQSEKPPANRQSSITGWAK